MGESFHACFSFSGIFCKVKINAMEKERIIMCALNRIFGFKPALGLFLLKETGGAAALWGMDREELRRMAGVYASYVDSMTPEALQKAGEELEKIYSRGARFTTVYDEGYPPLLKECADPPLGIYIKSTSADKELFASKPAVAIVGTRDMSSYGRHWTAKIVESLASAREKPLIVSGLAYGIDITAHRAAMEHGLPTIAVMPTGIDSVYPQRHLQTASAIASTPDCALVTDYPPGTAPLPIHFLRRNRIIAGLSKYLILTESRIRGGGMMTARLAYSYDRDVYAVPGRIDDERSSGCNLLLREKIAEPVTDVENLASRLGLDPAVHRKKADILNIIKERYGDAGTFEFPDMAAVARAIKGERGIGREEIAAVTGLDYGKVCGITELMASDGIITMDLAGHCSLN